MKAIFFFVACDRKINCHVLCLLCVLRGKFDMRVSRLGAAGCFAMMFATQAGASPVFQLRIHAGAYDSGVISGVVDPGNQTGSVSVSGLIISGGGGFSFTIPTL